MDERKNIGYVITDSVRIGETEFVIGAHEKDSNRFVTWACKNGNDYYWGHYLNSREAAERDLVARCQEQIRFLDSIRGKPTKAKMMYFEPENSPWGLVDHCETICPGVYSVSTPSHGGVMIRSDRAAEILSPSARRIGFHEYGHLCFEEDCDAPVALRELMDRGLMDAPVNNHFAPGEYSRIIDESLQRWHPEYWKDHEKGLTAPRQKQQKERER